MKWFLRASIAFSVIKHLYFSYPVLDRIPKDGDVPYHSTESVQNALAYTLPDRRIHFSGTGAYFTHKQTHTHTQLVRSFTPPIFKQSEMEN